jgi:hypothetical protein
MNHASRRDIEWECTKLIHAYAHLIDAQKWEEVADLFDAEGLMTRPTAPDQPIVGRDNILSHLKARPPRATRHVSANILVRAESESAAAAESVVLLFSGVPDPVGGLPIQDPAAPLVGYSQDRIVLNAEGWRFSERRGGLCFAKAV